MKREFKVEANIGAPQVAYRETIFARPRSTIPQEVDRRTGQFARVKQRYHPRSNRVGYLFESKIVGGAVPKEYIPGVEKGIKSAWIPVLWRASR
ncbi:MAG: hypothetical protein R3D56_01405 [Paracoccaceae bacterium]